MIYYCKSNNLLIAIYTLIILPLNAICKKNTKNIFHWFVALLYLQKIVTNREEKYHSSFNTSYVSDNLAISILLRSSTILLIVGLFWRSEFTHLNAISMQVITSCDACDHIVPCSLFSQFFNTCKMETKCWHVAYFQVSKHG
jgi:putative effector of murein hydrolase